MTSSRPIDAQTLLQLATGELDLTQRAALAKAALSDPVLARDLKLAMRLAQPAGVLASNLVSLNSENKAAQGGILALARNYFRWPALTAATAAALFVGLNLRVPQGPVPKIAMQTNATASDRFGPIGGFEGISEVSDRFNGGFETR
jgi:hypothetical protein